MIQAPFRRIAISALLASSPTGCDDEAIIQPAPDPPVIAPETVAPSPETPPVTVEDVEIFNGFMPDPVVIEGTTRGTFDAAEWDEACTGFVDPDLPHALHTDGAFAELFVLVESDEPVSVVIRTDGAYLCSSGAPTPTPKVTGAFGRGDHEVWVSAPTAGSEVEYLLGFSELAGVTHDELRPSSTTPPTSAH
ncbi:MAG: hypothetical protein AAGF12_20555 [Myxococcota bacterium]